MRNLSSFLVHLFGRDSGLNRIYLSARHDQCLLCEQPISESPEYLAYRVCPFCRFHYNLTARERIELLAENQNLTGFTGEINRPKVIIQPAAAN